MKSELKLYVLDRSWAGLGVVVAKSAEEAVNKFVDLDYYPRHLQKTDLPSIKKHIQEFEIDDQFRYLNYGDE